MSQNPNDTGAANSVFQTYELLEKIMLHLPSIDIVVTQRVAMHWQSVVQRSQDIQERLYLRASSEPINPILEEDMESPKHATAYKDTFKVNPMAGMRCLCGRSEVSENGSFAHLGLAHSSSSRSWGNQSVIRQHVVIAIQACQSFKGDHRDNIPFRQSYDAAPSWQRMLISQPPITAVRLGSRAIVGPSNFIYDDEVPICTIWNPKGLTFGDLFNGWWKVHADSGVRDPNWKTSSLGICLPLPLADDVLDQAVRDCGPLVTVTPTGYSTRSRSWDTGCRCVQVWQGE